LCLIALVIPPLQNVTPVGMRTLGIFLWTVTWWTILALLSIPLIATLGFYIASWIPG